MSSGSAFNSIIFFLELGIPCLIHISNQQGYGNYSMENFIIHSGFSVWFDSKPSLYQCLFSKDLYHQQCFANLDIHFPRVVQNALPKRQAEFLAGRYCAIKTLEKLNIDTRQIPIGSNREPIWPTGTLGSISHCSGMAIATVAICKELIGIGLDIEELVPNTQANKLKAIIFTEEESRYFNKLDIDQGLLFTIIFSIKESFFKAGYPTVGQYFGFYTISVVHLCLKSQTVRFKMNKTLNQHFQEKMVFEGGFKILPSNRVVSFVVVKQAVS